MVKSCSNHFDKAHLACHEASKSCGAQSVSRILLAFKNGRLNPHSFPFSLNKMELGKEAIVLPANHLYRHPTLSSDCLGGIYL